MQQYYSGRTGLVKTKGDFIKESKALVLDILTNELSELEGASGHTLTEWHFNKCMDVVKLKVRNNFHFFNRPAYYDPEVVETMISIVEFDVRQYIRYRERELEIRELNDWYYNAV